MNGLKENVNAKKVISGQVKDLARCVSYKKEFAKKDAVMDTKSQNRLFNMI